MIGKTESLHDTNEGIDGNILSLGEARDGAARHTGLLGKRGLTDVTTEPDFFDSVEQGPDDRVARCDSKIDVMRHNSLINGNYCR